MRVGEVPGSNWTDLDVEQNTYLVDFENPDAWTCRTAENLKEAKELIESGFEYVTDMDGFRLFRK